MSVDHDDYDDAVYYLDTKLCTIKLPHLAVPETRTSWESWMLYGWTRGTSVCQAVSPSCWCSYTSVPYLLALISCALLLLTYASAMHVTCTGGSHSPCTKQKLNNSVR